MAIVARCPAHLHFPADSLKNEAAVPSVAVRGIRTSFWTFPFSPFHLLTRASVTSLLFSRAPSLRVSQFLDQYRLMSLEAIPPARASCLWMKRVCERVRCDFYRSRRNRGTLFQKKLSRISFVEETVVIERIVTHLLVIVGYMLKYCYVHWHVIFKLSDIPIFGWI